MIKKTKQYRFYEMIPGFNVWITFLGLIILSFIKPVWAIYFIILYDLYWVLKIIYLMIFLAISWRRYQKTIKIDWLEKVKKQKNWDQIYHLIVLPTYKEGTEIIDLTFQHLIQINYPIDKFIVVLAGEERDKDNFLSIAEQIKNKYQNKFFKLLITVHPKDLPDEIPGKGSNTHWAGKEVKKLIDEQKIPYENIIVSCFDVDSCVHQEYFSYLTYQYLTVSDPVRTSFQPVALFNNNIWDSPALTRVVARGTTFWLLTELAKPQLHFTFSSHSMPFKALVEVDFWPKNVVSEDSRIFLKCLNHYNGNYKVIPLYLPISMDTVYCGKFWQTMKEQYKQMLRWGYGAENIPWMLDNLLKNKKIPWWKKWYPFMTQYEGSCSWATVSIVMLLLGYLPLWVGRLQNISNSIVFNAPFILEWLMNIALIGVFISAILSTILLPPRPTKHKSYRYIFMILQWILFPITMIAFGAIPAVEAITRLLLGKYLGFRVTEKKRLT